MKTKNSLLVLSGIIFTLFLAVPGLSAPVVNTAPAPPAQGAAAADKPVEAVKAQPPSAQKQNVQAQKQTPEVKGTVKVEAKTEAGEKREPIIYTIVKHDTLWGISEKFFNDPLKWPKLWKQNEYISNPDLIYPGNKVAITENGIEPVKTAVKQSEAEPIVEKAEPEAAEKEAQAVAKEEEKPVSPDQLPVEELEPRTENVVMLEPEVDQNATPEVVAAQKDFEKTPVSKDLERNGFITQKELGEVGSILKQKDNRIMIGKGDRVYMAFKSSEGVTPGALFSVFVLGDRVVHPVTGDKLGYLIDVVGIVQIRSVGDIVEAEVVKSYKEIYPGNNVMPYVEKTWDKKIVRSDKDVNGYIVMTLDGKNAVAKGDVVYIDKGEADGLVRGNVMNIYRHNVRVKDPYTGDKKELPFIDLGKLVVVDTEQETAAGIITESNRDIYKGDMISTKAR